MSRIDSFRGDNYYLSNFYPVRVKYDGITYQNNEAAFQAQKCVNPKDRFQFANASAADAKHLGRRVTLRKDWESVKVSLMRDIVRAKFEQNPDLADKLFLTGDAFLEEGNDWGDKIWGTVNGQGQNLLGSILAEIREDIVKERKDTENTEDRADTEI